MTVVPMKQRLLWSNGSGFVVAASSADFSTTPASVSYFSTGIASPVSADWLTNRSLELTRRMSAGIMSPADRCTMSPGTKSSNGTSRFSLTTDAEASSWAYRRVTVAVVRTMARERFRRPR